MTPPPKKSISYLLFWLQSHPNTAAGCLYLWRILPSMVRMMLLPKWQETCKTIFPQPQLQTVLLTSKAERRGADLPEAVSAACSDPFRILMAPWDAENTVLTMLRWGREAHDVQQVRGTKAKWDVLLWSMKNRFIIQKVLLFISFLRMQTCINVFQIKM